MFVRYCGSLSIIMLASRLVHLLYIDMHLVMSIHSKNSQFDTDPIEFSTNSLGFIANLAGLRVSNMNERL